MRHYFKSKKKHGIHSPFVYRFMEEYVLAPHASPQFDQALHAISKLKYHPQIIMKYDLGTGKKNMSYPLKISTMAIKTIKPRKYYKILFNVAHYIRAEKILELGTGLGTSALIMSISSPHVSVDSVEGCPNTLSIAHSLLKEMNVHNVTLIHSNFDHFIESLSQPYDLIFIDGNHAYAPTVKYFSCLWPLLSEKGCMILDDIHWNRSMHKAWNEIRQHPEVTLSLDFFQLGLLFKSKKFTKQHFYLRV